MPFPTTVERGVVREIKEELSYVAIGTFGKHFSRVFVSSIEPHFLTRVLVEFLTESVTVRNERFARGAVCGWEHIIRHRVSILEFISIDVHGVCLLAVAMFVDFDEEKSSADHELSSKVEKIYEVSDGRRSPSSASASAARIPSSSRR